MVRRLTDEDRDGIVAAYESWDQDAESVNELAERLGVSKQTLYSVLDSRGVPRKYRSAVQLRAHMADRVKIRARQISAGLDELDDNSLLLFRHYADELVSRVQELENENRLLKAAAARPPTMSDVELAGWIASEILGGRPATQLLSGSEIVAACTNVVMNADEARRDQLEAARSTESSGV